MADIDVVQKPQGGGGGSQTWIWALIAVLAVGALMAWLAVQSQRVSTAPVVQEEETTTEAEAAAGEPAETAELGDVAAAPDPFVGRRLAFEDVEIAAPLGPSAFWGEIPGANPFLVFFSPNLTERPALEAGQTFDRLVGVINVVTDSALTEWAESGAIRPGAQDEISFGATHYLLAERID